MKEIIRQLGFTKTTTQGEIEEVFLSVGDFTPEYYIIRKMGGFIEASFEVFEYLQSN